MTDYVWLPVTGTGTQADPYVWNSNPFEWNTPSFWAAADQLIIGDTNPDTGTVPGSGTGNSSGPGLDSVGLVAGEISQAALQTYNEFAPILGDPAIGSNEYQVDLTINAGTVDLQSLLMASIYSAQYSDMHVYPTLNVDGALLKLEGSIVNTYTAVFPSPIGTQSASGGGTIEIGTGGTVQVVGSVASEIMIDFQDTANDMLSLGGVSGSQPTGFDGTIVGFGSGDTIDLTAIPFDAGNTTSFDSTTGDLDVISGSSTLATLQFNGTYTPADFHLVNDGANATAIVTCFAAGTRIRTVRGEVPVESLRVGEHVPVVMEGADAPVVWIGHRRVDCSRHPHPEQVWPVRVAAGAFGDGTPRRDLYLSPDHAVFVDGVLIPVKYLINGEAIVQVKRDHVVYYHVELPRHDVLLAEGLRVESYLDSGDRFAFENGGGAVVAHPDFATRVWEADGCARLVVTGAELEAVRARVRDAAACLAAAA